MLGAWGMVGRKVWLLHREYGECVEIARARQEANDRNEVRDSRRGKVSSLETHLTGTTGEMAFCKLFLLDLAPLRNVRERVSSVRGEDEGADVFLYGKSVDVKTTPYTSGHLLIVP